MIQVEEDEDEEEEEEEEEVCLKMSNQDDEIKQQQQQVKNEPASSENDAASQRQQQQSMDDLFEQILNMPASFPDISQQSSDRLFSRSSMQGLSGLGSEPLDSYQFSYLQSMQQRQSESSALANAPLGPVNASAVALLTASSQQAWRLPYGSPGVQPFPLAIGQAQQQQQLGKRLREDEPRPPPTSNPIFLKNFGAAEGIRPNIPSSQTLPSIPFQSYDAHAGMAHQQQPPQSQAHHQQSLQPPSQASPITVASGQQVAASSPAAPAPTRPRVRARRGQATDPHSIAERQRRERIAERMKALQELVPTCNKTDKGAMLDEIIDYVKFLQLQVKVLSMSRIGGAEAVAPLVAEMSSEVSNGMQMGRNASTTDESLTVTEQQVARLMEQDTGAAMQYLQSKGMCLMPLSLAATLTGANPAAAAATVTATSRMHHSSSPHIIIRSPSSDTVENHREATGASTTVAAAAASAPASSTEASSVKPGPGPGCRAPSAGASAGAGAGPGPGPAQ